MPEPELWDTDPRVFFAAVLNRALLELDAGSVDLALVSIISDVRKYNGDPDALDVVEPGRWGALLEQGRPAVEAAAAGAGIILRPDEDEQG